MNDNDSPQLKKEQWETKGELPQDVYLVLRKDNQAINPITLVATVDPDGKPRTAPFGSLRAVSPNILRFACSRFHNTHENLCRNNHVSVAVLCPPDIAVSIKGRVKIIKPQMAVSENFVTFQIDIEEVKNDMTQRGLIESAIGFTPLGNHERFFKKIISEIEAIHLS